MRSTQWSRHLFKYPFKFKPATQQPQPVASFSSLLNLCNKTEFLQQIHARFILHGLQHNPTLSSNLITRYADLGRLDLSQTIFDSEDDPDALLYNTIIRNLSIHGKSERILLVYHQMVTKSMYPDEFTYPFVLKSCGDLLGIETGVKIHTHLIKLGYESDVHVGTALVDMYAKCNEILDARRAVEGMPVRDWDYWNALIFSFYQNGDPVGCFRLFRRMRLEGVKPDVVDIVYLLRLAADLECLEAGRCIHVLIILNGFGSNLSVNTSLLTMYSKLGSLDTATLVFEKMPERDCVVWNIMIAAYSRNGYSEKALELLILMQKSGARTDLFTAIAAITSTAELKSIDRGKQIHAHVIRNGSDYQVSVCNSLIEMYSKCGNLNLARKIFDSLADKTVVSWSSMIKGYVSRDCSSDALSLFRQMRMDGIRFDSITVINILPACVNIGALEQVKNIHGYSIKHGLSTIVTTVTAILVSYAKCGCIEMAQKMFDEEEIDDKDIISWNSMISAYAKHGDWARCFELYNRMQDSKVRPDQITFVGLLTACVNSGLVKEAWECFNQMSALYGCRPTQEHYACMVDLLGRLGYLGEAISLIKTMPFEPDARVWGPLLSACKMHSEIGLAEFAAKKLIEMEPKNAGNYVLLSNIYAAAGKWDDAAKMRGFIRDRGLKKTPGCSWLEINGRVHEFRVADHSHPRSEDIYTILKNLELEIKDDADMGSKLLS
ncbi:pentatricopeptide repeat-containing protein At4g19191, mitochondrial-like [Magnolia sinica]|uniref:pentatricopeptide repeat-containing protein At4g19191, mitochondrial-like n=1 Tax=Magnolia sinica TaxID=86752 RepID=UPI002659BF02|nr:pentatricopeptide repeat-containing protein At4g19191, mitochondrial-like [Magnolia sinica]